MSKNIYWSYSKTPSVPAVVIEHTLKYADTDEIKELLVKYGREKCLEVWHKTMLYDERYRKMNFFLAKFIFEISTYDKVVSEYIKQHSKTRAQRINEVFNRTNS